MKNFLKIIAAVFVLHGVGYFLFGNRLELPADTVHFYSPAAVSLLKGEGYQVNGAFSARYPPVYPLFIATVYGLTRHPGMDNPFYPWFVILLQSFSCGFLYLISAEFFSKRTAFLSAILFAAYPFFAVLSMTRYVWTAMPVFMVLFYAALYCFLRARKAWNPSLDLLSGLLLGLSSLVWPADIYLWPVFAVFSLILSPGWRISKKTAAVVCLCAGFFAPVLGWGFEVYRHTGQWEVSSGGMLSMRDGLIHESGTKFKKYEFARDAAAEASLGGLRNLKDAANFYKNEFLKKPAATARYFFFKFFRPWYGTDSENHEGLIFMIQLPYLLLGTAGILKVFQKQRAAALFFAAIILYFWLVAFSVLSILRYMSLAMGLLMIFAASTITRFKDEKGSLS